MSDILLSVGLKDGTQKMSVVIPEEEYATIESEKLGKTIKSMVVSVKQMERMNQENKDE